MKRIPFVLVMILTLSVSGLGQSYDTSPGAQTGRLPFSSYAGGDIDSISLYNGNLSIHLPVLTLPGRELSTGLRALYNSQKWQSAGFLGEEYGAYTGGWRLHDLIGEKPTLSVVLIDCINDFGYWDVVAYWVDGFGTKRLYTITDYIELEGCENTPTGGGLELDSVNGDQSMLSTIEGTPVGFILHFGNGVHVDFQDMKIYTPHGNYLQRDAHGLPPHDTLNRTIEFDSSEGAAQPEK